MNEQRDGIAAAPKGLMPTCPLKRSCACLASPLPCKTCPWPSTVQRLDPPAQPPLLAAAGCSRRPRYQACFAVGGKVRRPSAVVHANLRVGAHAHVLAPSSAHSQAMPEPVTDLKIHDRVTSQVGVPRAPGAPAACCCWGWLRGHAPGSLGAGAQMMPILLATSSAS